MSDFILSFGAAFVGAFVVGFFAYHLGIHRERTRRTKLMERFRP